jgi:hypothetical protein
MITRFCLRQPGVPFQVLLRFSKEAVAMNILRVFTLSLAVVAVAPTSTVLLAQRGGAAPAVNQKEEEKRSKNQQEDIAAVSELLNTVTTAEPVSPTSAATEMQQGEVKITWDANHFIKGQGGQSYVPYSLTIDRKALSSSNAVVYIRAVNKNAPAPAAPPAGNDRNRQQAAPAPTYAWNDWNFISLKDDGKIARAMMLPGGEYDVFVVVKDQSTGDKKQVASTGLLRRKLTVPDFTTTELMTSSVLLGEIDQLPSALNATQQRENPYTFGVMKVTPTMTGKFPKTGELALIFWIYGAGTDAITRRPNLTVDYNFYQKNADGTEKYFNKTAPQDLNATTLPAEMDVTTGLPGVMSVPMMVFPAADYRLEIKVNDKAAGKTVTQNLTFSVNPS